MGGKVVDDFLCGFDADTVRLLGEFLRCHLGDGFDGAELRKQLLATVFADAWNIREERVGDPFAAEQPMVAVGET